MNDWFMWYVLFSWEVGTWFPPFVYRDKWEKWRFRTTLQDDTFSEHFGDARRGKKNKEPWKRHGTHAKYFLILEVTCRLLITKHVGDASIHVTFSALVSPLVAWDPALEDCPKDPPSLPPRLWPKESAVVLLRNLLLPHTRKERNEDPLSHGLFASLRNTTFKKALPLRHVIVLFIASAFVTIHLSTICISESLLDWISESLCLFSSLKFHFLIPNSDRQPQSANPQY